MDDLGRLRDLEERLLTADTELSALFDHSLELVCELDSRGSFKRLNSRWEAELGYSIDEMASTPLAAFVHTEDLMTTRDAFSRLRSQGAVTFENRMRHRDGTNRSLRWSATRLRATDVILAIARDVTSEHRSDSIRGTASLRKGVSTSYGLTRREIMTLNFLVEGKSNKEIAELMKISPATVSTYVASILRKMRAASRAEAAARAIREAVVR